LTYIKYNFLIIFIIIFLTSCTNKQKINNHENKIENNKTSSITITHHFENIKDNTLKEQEKFKTTKINFIEKEFLSILKIDKYESLCSSKKLYQKIKTLDNSTNKSKLIEKLLLQYTNNLANGCININDMNKKIARNKRNKIKTSYTTYHQYVNKKRILKQYRSNNVSINTILKHYIPTHPSFMSFIKVLHSKKLSKKLYYKLRLNIERLKIMKKYNTKNFIQLNIPSYSFNFYENGSKSMNFGTIVGDLEDQTPILSSKVNYFIVNPAWNIPDSIAKKTIIPRMLKDKKYLKRKHIEIHKNYYLTSKRFYQKDIKWKKYLKKHVRYIPYKFIQLPSNTNGMGRVKFIFPNKYAVYMHDTIGSWRFKSSRQGIRAVSHGCVRLENPLALIKHISTYYTKRSYASVRRDYDSHMMKTIGLSKKLPIHITYLTAYIKNGNLHFYKDLYGYDSLQKLNFRLN